MNKYLQIGKYEFVHLLRSPFKIIASIIFIVTIIYSCQNGYDLFKAHNNEINVIKVENDSSIIKMISIYEDLEKGVIEKPRRDPTAPYWAIWNVPSYVFKYPFPMMIFSLGQSEQFGYYKEVSNWSTVFDSDLVEEIANPERLAIGTLDFNFVLLYLAPILIIILLFNIGGLEKDFRFDNFIFLNNVSKSKWLLIRFSFYFLLMLTLIGLTIIPYVLLSDILNTNFMLFLGFLLVIFSYIFMWFSFCYFINLIGKGSSYNSLMMILVWLIFCIILPGSIHQITSLKFPNQYMVNYLDANRDQTYDIFDLPLDTLNKNLLSEYPDLRYTKHALDSIINKSIVNRSLSALVNLLNKNVINEIEELNEQKNKFIQSSFILNPVIFFQNKINDIAKTDYYAYKRYRNSIQQVIDKKINLIMFDTWNEVIVDKDRYIKYVENLKK